MDTFFIMCGPKVLAQCKWGEGNQILLERDYGLPNFISRDIYYWLSERVPKDRPNMEVLWKSAGVHSLKDAVFFSKALSIIDTFWIAKSENESWKDVTLLILFGMV